MPDLSTCIFLPSSGTAKLCKSLGFCKCSNNHIGALGLNVYTNIFYNVWIITGFVTYTHTYIYKTGLAFKTKNFQAICPPGFSKHMHTSFFTCIEFHLKINLKNNENNLIVTQIVPLRSSKFVTNHHYLMIYSSSCKNLKPNYEFGFWDPVSKSICNDMCTWTTIAT